MDQVKNQEAEPFGEAITIGIQDYQSSINQSLYS